MRLLLSQKGHAGPSVMKIPQEPRNSVAGLPSNVPRRTHQTRLAA